MAVQDGYGKSSGSESLVFAYDLKDTINSYRGQPATNIWTSGNPNGHGSGIEIIQTNYFLGKVIDSGVVYRNYLTNPAQSDTSTYYNNGGLNIGSMSFSNLNPSTRYIQISFDYYGVTPYRRFCCSGTGLNGYLGVRSTDSTNDTYGWDTTYSPGSGDDWNNDASRMGYWQKISLIVALRGDKNPSNIWALYIYLDATTQGEGYFANMIFTEHSSYPTGPIRWTSGTRSNTQGLLDLTGNNIINVSAVSYDSNASIVFDGTDDYILLPSSYTTFVNRPRREITVNMILKFYNFNGQQEIMRTNGAMEFDVGEIGGSGSGRMSFWIYDGGWLSTDYDVMTNVGTNVWFMVTGVYSNVTNRHELYINGNLVTTGGVGGGTGLDLGGSGSTFIGAESTGALHFNGEIKVCQIYNKPLSSIEITNNYLKYKRQYGLT